MPVSPLVSESISSIPSASLPVKDNIITIVKISDPMMAINQYIFGNNSKFENHSSIVRELKIND
ncbi:hypothetical protein GCM10022397_17630 [Flavivirga jejuensis]